MGHGQYILVGHKAVRCEDQAEIAKFFSKPNSRRVAVDDRNGTSVSTVFLVMDHRHTEGDENPILFETMIFKDKDDGGSGEYCMRYETWEEAEEGHLAACAIAFGSDDEVTKKKLEWKENMVFDRMTDEMAEKMLDAE